MSVLTKDKIIDRFRKYFGGKKAMNNRTTSKRNNATNKDILQN